MAHYQVDVAKAPVQDPDWVGFGANLPFSTRLYAGPLGIDAEQILRFNSFEYARVSLPFVLLKPRYWATATLGYGINDRAWKGQAVAGFSLKKWRISANASRDLQEANNPFQQLALSRLEQSRGLYLLRFNRVAQVAGAVETKNLRAEMGLRRNWNFATKAYAAGPFFMATIDMPIRGTAVQLSNGFTEYKELSHLASFSMFGFSAQQQRFVVLRPNYLFATSKKAFLQVRVIASGHVLLGKNPGVLDPIVAGNGVDFNTAAEGALENLMPTSLSARQAGGIFLSLEKPISISADVPYQPVPFIRINRSALWNTTLMGQNTHLTGVQNITEIGAGIQNLFVFPLPVLRPSIGLGYFVGFYPSALKQLQSGGLKFTLRFFN